jgi:hypothetical protein
MSVETNQNQKKEHLEENPELIRDAEIARVFAMLEDNIREIGRDAVRAFNEHGNGDLLGAPSHINRLENCVKHFENTMKVYQEVKEKIDRLNK